jgi:autotransporter-associated beta strand protein
MKTKIKTHLVSTTARLLCGPPLAAIAFVFGGSSAFGQNRAWVGATDANWGTASNWELAAVPASTTSAVFNGAGGGNTTISLGDMARAANRVVFTTDLTAAYTFQNNTGLTITIPSAGNESVAIRSGVTTSQDLSGIANLRPSNLDGTFNVINNGSGTLTLPTWIGQTNRAQTADFAGSGLIEVKGAGIQTRQIANTVSVTKNGAGTLVLYSGGTVDPGGSTQGRYNGTTTINAGVLRVRHDFALGTTASGTTVATGAALELQETTESADLSVGEPLVLNGGGISDDGVLRNISGDNTLAGLITLASDTRIHSDAGTLTLENAISGDFSLTLGGAGTITLAGISSYTGTTTVETGTLQISGQLDTSDLTVLSDALLGGGGVLGGNLHFESGAGLVFSQTDTLEVNGASVSFDGFGIANLAGFSNAVPVGTYFLLDGAATVNPANLDNVGTENAFIMGDTGKQAYFETGSLNLVVSGPATDAYADWATTKGLAGPDADFDADPDGDGIANGLEFVLGGEPSPGNANWNSLDLLPTAQAQGDDLVFTYSRSNAAAYLNPAVEFSNSLTGSWTTAVHGLNATIEVTDGSPSDTVFVTIPKNGAPTLFARLKVMQVVP